MVFFAETRSMTVVVPAACCCLFLALFCCFAFACQASVGSQTVEPDELHLLVRQGVPDFWSFWVWAQSLRRWLQVEMGIKEMLDLTRVPSILLLGMVYVAYVLIGGVIFWKLEGDLGKKDISNILLNKQKLFSTYTCLNHQGLVDVAQVRSQ